MPSARTAYDCVVLGAGVLGLSIATELQTQGLRVAIIARDLPEDKESAGTPFVYTWNKEEGYADQWYQPLVFDYQRLEASSIPKGYKFGIGFTSYTLNPPAYIAHLAKSLRDRGVPIVRHRLSSLDEAYSLLGPVELVVNATGLGSRSLLGVEDLKVFPARGQTVLVRAPNVRTCYSIKDPHRLQADGQQTYIIPRPGPEGHVILGGTFIRDEYSTLPDPATAERILRDTYELCPALSEGRGWEGIEVVSHNVGLRPAREGGMRLELEVRTVGAGNSGLLPERGTVGKGRKVAVVHAYGIGPAGFQASLGVAEEAVGLALEYLNAQDKARL
ncbi:MAG: hypothetical protein TREMPRED_003751 [Tremellales sp. Tagirdzhanova-0007]|nr:MAG: hypothetical protein TREMPRED_003751 [Tremellales sp. Tagirdzhanova-0007]